MDESKRKQYIRVLRIAANHADDGMITVSVDEVREIIDLLTEQETRVLTKKEVECDCPDCVYFETRTGWLECSVKDEGESDRYFGVFVYGCNEWFMRSYEVYGKTWRCWTARPSEKMRNEVPWDE